MERGRETYAIEVKASRTVGASDLRGLVSFREFAGNRYRPIVAYVGPVEREINGVAILPWQAALREIGL